MEEVVQTLEVEALGLRDVAAELFNTLPFATTTIEQLAGVDRVEKVTVRSGGTLVEAGQPTQYYWVVLDGDIRAERREPDGSWVPVGLAHTGEGFGETPILMGKTYAPFQIQALRDSTLLRFDEQSFWSLLACCPTVRKVVLGNWMQRIATHQVEALHREKLVTLGTMAAGLMHELNNPGAAAKRAASQLRENLKRLQELSLRSSSKPKTAPQLECMHNLLDHAMRSCQAPALSSIEQSDAEEAMAEWLDKASVDNAYTIAPVLVDFGFDPQQLDCARDAFEAGGFSDALNWLAALVSSVSLVCAIEESISRVTDLVMAVKKFAYDDRSTTRTLDVHDSLQSTLTILGHKLRLKQIAVDKRFDASPSTIQTRGSALSQVWTNLIDNAIDASTPNSHIEIATWSEPAPEPAQPADTAAPAGGAAPQQAKGWLAVSITDHGTGIPPEVKPRIFEAFFTTKPQGSGTGLGLEIVHRIITQLFGGAIEVESEPGNTCFTIRLPLSEALPQTAKSSS